MAQDKKSSDEILKELFNSIHDIVPSSDDDEASDVEKKVVVKKERKSKSSYDRTYSSKSKKHKKKKKSKKSSTKYSLSISSEKSRKSSCEKKSKTHAMGNIKTEKELPLIDLLKKEVIESVTEPHEMKLQPSSMIANVKIKQENCVSPQKKQELGDQESSMIVNKDTTSAPIALCEKDQPSSKVADVFIEDLMDSGEHTQAVILDKVKKTIQIKNLENSTILKDAAKLKEGNSKKRKYEDGELSDSLSDVSLSDSSLLTLTPDEGDDSGVLKKVDHHRKHKIKKKKKKSKHSRKDHKRGGSKRHSERSDPRIKEEVDKGKIERRVYRRSKSRSPCGSEAVHKLSSHRKSRHRDRHKHSSSRSRSQDKTKSPNSRDRSRLKVSVDRDDPRERVKRKHSRERSPDWRSGRSRDPSRLSNDKTGYFIDKGKLLEIARKNALSMLKQGHVGGDMSKVVLTAGGKTVDELTDFCKHLSRKEATGVESESSDSSSDESEKAFHHPFLLKERPNKIIMNIRNMAPIPVKTHQEMATENLRLQFPVSSGQQHRKTESEWVPVSPKNTEPKPTPSKVVKDQAAPKAIEPPPPPPPATQYPTVYPNPAERRPIDISAAISERLAAIRNETESAHKPVYQTGSSGWGDSSVSGLFTGSTGARMLTPSELASGQQAWARRDQLMSALPVSGGFGMSLLQKMGWKPGEGLGKNSEGTLEPLKLPVKMDKKGLVCAEEMSHRQQLKKVGIGPVKPALPVHKSYEGKHPVSLLNEYCTRKRFTTPEFETVSENGPPHQKRFIMKVTVNGIMYIPSITSSTKKLAKSEAAKACLRALGVLPSV